MAWCGSRKKRDLLPIHGWFPKLFQNLFILKSHKRMFSETKVKRKMNILDQGQSQAELKREPPPPTKTAAENLID